MTASRLAWEVSPNDRHIIPGCQRNDRSLMDHQEGVGHKCKAGFFLPKRNSRRPVAIHRPAARRQQAATWQQRRRKA
jgi:hypothetical protein